MVEKTATASWRGSRASWALPNYADRSADHETPIGYQPDPEQADLADLSQLLAALAAEGANQSRTTTLDLVRAK